MEFIEFAKRMKKLVKVTMNGTKRVIQLLKPEAKAELAPILEDCEQALTACKSDPRHAAGNTLTYFTTELCLLKKLIEFGEADTEAVVNEVKNELAGSFHQFGALYAVNDVAGMVNDKPMKWSERQAKIIRDF